ncbi:hypothetical protein SDRG_08875 [Saprolegnia diclina VS20]|uniref:Uncharacterized protein n=1 Tax=Saprolegnia diclina (strain VS20) TaxID=1156394 RepID=T0RN45_SAPDV|nr:hypothetical protein SDRG_08875 [Saprolegnia diclina VS20]EQC33773.1 hypothetical protein SDRG_08875 [Saprolegnia diclina VS20]|eukprot:XP_008612996.1 hypothetical protein SDRG_08875 [Saprolegnia diclina VS20]
MLDEHQHTPARRTSSARDMAAMTLRPEIPRAASAAVLVAPNIHNEGPTDRLPTVESSYVVHDTVPVIPLPTIPLLSPRTYGTMALPVSGRSALVLSSCDSKVELAPVKLMRTPRSVRNEVTDGVILPLTTEQSPALTVESSTLLCESAASGDPVLSPRGSRTTPRESTTTPHTVSSSPRSRKISHHTPRKTPRFSDPNYYMSIHERLASTQSHDGDLVSALATPRPRYAPPMLTRSSTMPRLMDKDKAMHKLGVNEELLRLEKGMKKLGICDHDIQASLEIRRHCGVSFTSMQSKTETLLGFSEEQLRRIKAVKQLGTTEAEILDNYCQKLSTLGVSFATPPQ